MQRRDFLAAATIAGIAATSKTVKGDILIPKHHAESHTESSNAHLKYILLETYRTESVQKRDELLKAFDSELIRDRNELGFDKVGIFYVDSDLMKDDRGYDSALYDSAVFVVQESSSVDSFAELQSRTAYHYNHFNLAQDLQYIDEEMVVLRSLVCQPCISVPNLNPERLLQLRTYNSPNYERNLAKCRMFENGELDLFRRCGMEAVFMGGAVFGSWIPNITYMLSFENDEARREGWNKFVNHPEWKQMSSDPQYARTATRIRNLFLRPSQNSQI